MHVVAMVTLVSRGSGGGGGSRESGADVDS
jgi:hypothetical protein